MHYVIFHMIYKFSKSVCCEWIYPLQLNEARLTIYASYSEIAYNLL